MGLNSYGGEWVVKRFFYFFMPIFVAIGGTALSYAVGVKSTESLPADTISAGCSVSFLKEIHADKNDPLSDPPFALVASWQCNDSKRLIIDRYEINGSSPEVITVFYWRKRYVVVLARWQVNSHAADYSGEYYKVFIYEYDGSYLPPRFIKSQWTCKYFPAGFDGVAKDGSRVEYPFKDAASIRKKLRTLNLQ